VNVGSSEDRDRIVLNLLSQLLDIEQRLIPTGMHVFGRPPGRFDIADLLVAVASFGRPEHRTRPLPDLVAAGLRLSGYETLLRESGTVEAALRDRERVEAIVRRAVNDFLEDGAEAASAFLKDEAHVQVGESLRVFALLGGIKDQLGVNHEVDALVRALHGEYIEPGPGADIVQNPDILPTGRNTHAVNPYGVPSAVAFEKAEGAVAGLLERRVRDSGRFPETIAMVLWGMDNIKTHGEGVGQALRLLGVAPRRDAMNRVAGVEPIPLDRLRRPRIDVVLMLSGIFRDLFGPTMELLDSAVRLVARLDEPPEANYVRKHVQEQAAAGASPDEAAVRVFSNAAGNYGTNVNFMVLDRQWERPEQVGEVFMRRKCFAYGHGFAGRHAQELLERALSRVELTYQNLDSAEIGITDVDHYFEYLGGLSRAVQMQTGNRPAIYLSDSISRTLKVRSVEELVALETRAKTLNPKWYDGILRHGYSGVAEIEHHVANTFGWSATADAVDNWVYSGIAKTFVLDESMLGRLRSLNPHATRELASRLLEASGRGFWSASAAELARLREVTGNLEDRLEGVS
jgi:magnesium chelatase subunit H